MKKTIKQIRITVLMVIALMIASLPCFAEMDETERSIVGFVGYLKEMAYTGEYTEGIPHKDIEVFVATNIDNLLKVYKTNESDVFALGLLAERNVKLPESYKKPTKPSDDEMKWLMDELKKSLDIAFKQSNTYKEHDFAFDATGKDWQKYTVEEKRKVVEILYGRARVTSEQFPIQNTIAEMDKHFSVSSENLNQEAILNEKCYDVVRAITKKN